MVLIIQIAAAIVAAARGWGALAIGLAATPFLIGFTVSLGGRISSGTVWFVMLLDWVVAGVLIAMAILGRKSVVGAASEVG